MIDHEKFNTDDSVVVRKFKVTNGEFYLVNATSSVGLGLTRLLNTNDSNKTAVYVCVYLYLIVLCWKWLKITLILFQKIKMSAR